MRHSRITGRELHSPSNELVANLTGSTLPKLKVVALDNMALPFPKVKVANPALYQNFGVVLDGIDDQKYGIVTCFGFITDINTSAWIDETPLYSTATGDLTDTPNGPVIARVVRSHATTGSIYVFGPGGPACAPWDVDGNSGLGSANFLGTVDSVALRFRTDNLERAIFDENGRFGHGTSTPGMFNEIKAHSSANASGLQTETFYVETNAATFQPAFSLILPDPMICQVTLSITCHEPGGTNVASFKRTGVFYRKSSGVVSLGGWQSDFTQKSNNVMNIQYILTLGSVDFNVKAASATNTRWAGYIQVQRLI